MKSSKSPSIFSQNIFDSIYNQKEARSRKTSGKTVSLLQKLMSSKKSRGISYSTLNSSGINQPRINYRETGLFAKLRIHKRIVGHMSHVLHVEFDRKYERIFTGSDDNLVKCWCTKTGRLIQTFRGLDCGVLYISISQDNRVLAVAGRGTVLSCPPENRSALVLEYPLQPNIFDQKLLFWMFQGMRS